jgi:hypothetical protein
VWVRAFLIKLPSFERYWTVIDEDYRVVGAADEYLQHLRLGQDAAESTTKAYAEATSGPLPSTPDTLTISPSPSWNTTLQQVKADPSRRPPRP